MKKTIITFIMGTILYMVLSGNTDSESTGSGIFGTVLSTGVGVGEAFISKNVDSKTKEAWEKSGLNKDYNDWKRNLGIDQRAVEGGANFYNGKTNAGIFDVSESFVKRSGVYSSSTNEAAENAFNILRAQNQRNEDLKSGMDPKEANEKYVQSVSSNVLGFQENIKDARQAELEQEKEAIISAIEGRGYNESEAYAYYYMLRSEEQLSKDPDEISRILNNYNIRQKETPSSEMQFFGVPTIEAKHTDNTHEVVIGTSIANNSKPEPIIKTNKEYVYDIEVKELSQTVISQYKYLGHKLTDEQKSELDKIVTFMNKWPNAKVTIVGHTCSIGKHEDNLRLGLRRAHQAKLYLMEQGIDGNRISEDSMAAESPCADNDTEEGRLQNRRITFVIN